MNCSNCGQPVADNGLFCVNCGSLISADPSAQPREALSLQDVVLPPVEQIPPLYEHKTEEPLYTLGAAGRPRYILPNASQPEPKAAPQSEGPLPDLASLGAEPRPMIQLPTRRSLVKMIFLRLLTLGIYPLVIFSRISQEINMVASRHDGRRTMSYLGCCMLSPFTLFIAPIVWEHRLCVRIGDELQRRTIPYKFGASAFWLWNVLGSLILVGPFIYTHKLMKAMNLLNADYNEKG